MIIVLSCMGTCAPYHRPNRPTRVCYKLHEMFDAVIWFRPIGAAIALHLYLQYRNNDSDESSQ